MLGKIDKDFYCSAGIIAVKGTAEKNGYCRYMDTRCVYLQCPNYHRKYPTPAQFKEEYGFDYPDDGAVWNICKMSQKCYVNPGEWWGDWELIIYKNAKPKSWTEHLYEIQYIVCACTPFDKPANDWRPDGVH